MMINRRHFLATAAAAALPMHSVRWARAATPTDSALIVVFLRGGMDSLNFFAPASDPLYEAARPPELRVGKGLVVGDMKGAGEFLLHPEASGLASLWRNGQLAFIPASGLRHGTRSHFQAMDLIEKGVAGESTAIPRDGWLTRASLALGKQLPGSIVCMGGALPQSLSLCEGAMPISDMWDLEWAPSTSFREALFEIHNSDSALDVASRTAMNATSRLALKLDRTEDSQPKLRDLPKGIQYTDDDYGNKFRFLAEMLRIAPDISVGTIDIDGWDTHDSQAEQFPNLIRILSQNIQAFENHLNDFSRKHTIVVMSEFGRRLKANESRGTDHGHAGLMMVLGNDVKGGQNIGTWPGLAVEQLDQGMDLAITTDFRDVLGTVLHKHGGQSVVTAAFPRYTPSLLSGLFST